MYAFESFFEHVKRLLQLKQNNTKQIQNNVSFQTLLHVKQNTETISRRFGIVLELFQSCFRLINVFIHMLKNMQIPKQFQRSQPITNQMLLHVKQNTETISRRLGIVLELFCVVLFQM